MKNKCSLSLVVSLVFIILSFGCGGDGGFGESKVIVTPTNPSIAKGTTQQFKATFSQGDISFDVTSAATWTSSDTTTATIDSAGLAYGAGTGVTTITAAYGSPPIPG